MEPHTNQEPVTEAESASSTDTAAQPDPASTEAERSEQRSFAILGYILPFLFFLPLFNDKLKDVPFSRFHANQQLVLLVAVFATQVVHNFVLFMMMSLGFFVYQVLNFCIVALAIFGAFYAYKGEMKELPFIGQFRILK